MQIKYDKEADALYIRLLAGDISAAWFASPTTSPSTLRRRTIVGIEVLCASRCSKTRNRRRWSCSTCCHGEPAA